MVHIIADIVSLIQYINLQPNFRAVDRCICGRANPWFHGHYPRKADREDGGLNPILIQRFYCPLCRKTCSVLPECIPRRRWYLWKMQQAVVLLVLSGRSVRAISKELPPSRHTIARWSLWLKDRFDAYKQALCSLFSELGRTNGLSSFWLACLEKMPLSKAMRLCHESGVDVP